MPARRVYVDTAGATCPTKQSAAVLAALQAAVIQRGLSDQVVVLARGCFGLCRLAPNMYIEPDGVWYSRFSLDDVEEIVEEHLIHGRVVQRLVHHPGGSHDTSRRSRSRD